MPRFDCLIPPLMGGELLATLFPPVSSLFYVFHILALKTVILALETESGAWKRDRVALMRPGGLIWGRCWLRC